MSQTRTRPDVELKMLVLEALDHDQGLDTSLIGVSVSHGAVMLSGQVSSYPEKLRAQKAALKVHGVNVVDDALTVKTDSRVTDMDLARAASQALAQAVNIPADSVRVVVQHHVVTLSGCVPWDFQRAAATRAVSHLGGVTLVIDDIRVAPDVSPVDMRDAIQTAFGRSGVLCDRKIDVFADGGAVTLEGEVHSQQEVREATATAWSAPGVRSVQNNLRTAYWGQAVTVV